MDHYQLRFKTIPDEKREELARIVVGMFPYVLDCLYSTGDELSGVWHSCIAPLKKYDHHVASDTEDPTAEDAEIRNTIKHCFETITRIEEVLGELGMR